MIFLDCGLQKLLCPSPWPSPRWLRDSHILCFCCYCNAFEHGCQLRPAPCHGFRSGRFVVAVPASKPGHNPGKPGQRALFMGVFLTLGPAFQGFADHGGRLYLARVDDIGGRAL